MAAVSDGTRLEMPSLEGYLFKRSPKKNGILGAVSLQGWQRRWCAFFPKAGKFCYSKQPKDMDGEESKLQGIIPIDRIEKIMVLHSKSSKTTDRRFDLQMEGGRVFCFQALSQEDAQRWVQALATCQKARVKSLEKGVSSTAYWKPGKRQVETKTDLSIYFENSAFVHRMTAAQVRTLASFFTKERLNHKAMVFSESGSKLTDMSDEGVFYVILKGEVSLYLESVQSNVCFCVKQAGDFLDASTLVQGARIATAFCTTDVECLRLTMLQLAAYLSEHRAMKQVVQPLMGINPAPELKSFPMFAGMQTRKLHLIACLLRYVSVAAGQVLFEERAPSLAMYFLVQGTVQAEASDRAGNKRVLHTFCAGEIFGEAGVLLDMPRLATLTVKTSSLLLELRKQDVNAFMQLMDPEETTLLNTLMQQQVASNFRKYKTVPFFAAIPDEKYKLLADLALIRQFPPNTVLFREGEVGKKFYIIACGKIRVTQERDVGGAQTALDINIVGPGNYFGEIALVKDKPRLATITTIERCVMLTLSKANFEKFCQEVPEAVADFEVKLARTGVGLRSVIFHKLGLKVFREHLKSEFSEENITFWKYARNFRMLLDRRFEETFQEAREGERSSSTARFSGRSFESERKRWTHVVSCWEAVAHTKSSESALVDRVIVSPLAAPQGLPKSQSSMTFSTSPSMNQRNLHRAGAQIQLDVAYIDEKTTKDVDVLNEEVDEVDYSWVTRTELKEGVKIVLGVDIDEEVAKRCALAEDADRVTNESWVAAFDYGGESLPLRAALDKILEFIYTGFTRFAEDNCLDPKQFADAITYLGHVYDANEARTAFSDLVLAEARMRERLTSRPPARNRVSYDQLVRWHFFESVQKHQYRRLVHKQARHIFDKWIDSKSSTQVNLMSSSLISLAKDMQKGRICATMFEGAETEIFNLMAADSFTRFKCSKLFLKFLDEAESYDAAFAATAGGEKNALTAKKKATEARLRSQSCLTRDLELSQVSAASPSDTVVFGNAFDVSQERVSVQQNSNLNTPSSERVSRSRPSSLGARVSGGPGTPRISQSASAIEISSSPRETRISFIVPPEPPPLDDPLPEDVDEDELERISAVPDDLDTLRVPTSPSHLPRSVSSPNFS